MLPQLDGQCVGEDRCVECVGQPSLYEDITLRNITIVDPLFP